MKRLRTALLGCGTFAHRHAQNLTSLESDIDLVAFCDCNEEKAQAYSQQYCRGEANIYTDHHDLLDREELDLLVVTLPPYGHSDEVELAAQRGVHLLMEKPIALTSEHAWRMVAAVEAAGIKTQAGFMFRFGEAVEQLKVYLQSGEAGRPGLMSARYFCNSLHAPWWRSREKSGGQLVEQVIHMVDLMRYLLGEPTSVYSRQENLFHQSMPDYTIEDVSVSVFGFQSGAMGVIYATNGAIPNRWINDYRFVAERLTAEFTNANSATFHFTAGQAAEPQVIAGQRNVHLCELQDLIHAIHEGGETRTPLREGARSLDAALAARRSAEMHCELNLLAGDASR
ncbi:MAG: gfo/Idh/MocA family oxidoreductase [Chloroflexota bacterium]|nr:MAG: gfo/Idh/MocA family oxidoreductase [Chloroflexota bacterium]